MPIRISRAASSTVSFSSPQEVIISHVDDSIRLGDGSSLVTTTTNGGDVGLDVNIINDSIDIELSGAGTPTIYNVTSPGTANTEFSQALSANTKQFMIRVRGNAKLQFSFASGTSGSNFITIPPGSNYHAEGVDVASATIYMQANKASQTIEILEWK